MTHTSNSIIYVSPRGRAVFGLQRAVVMREFETREVTLKPPHNDDTPPSAPAAMLPAFICADALAA